MSTLQIRDSAYSAWTKVTTGNLTIVNEDLVLVDKTSGAATSIVLPAASLTNARRTVMVVDAKGDGAANNITVTVSGSGTINGASSYVINSNFGKMTFIDVGDEWQTLTGLEVGAVEVADKNITTAQMLALNATPITVIAAPGASIYLEFLSAYLYLDYNSAAYGGIAAGEDLVFKYTGSAGAAVSTQVETTGFLDQTASGLRVARPIGTDPAALVLVANAPIVLHLLVGEITTGDSPLKVRAYYRKVLASSLHAIA